MSDTWVKLKRSESTNELLKRPNEFMLLSVIAIRARRTYKFNANNLEIGEALIGDYSNYGLTEQKYRLAKKNLESWGLATFKGTNKGTIAKIVNSDIYCINVLRKNEQENERGTDEERTDNEPGTTNKNVKNVKNVKKKHIPKKLFLDCVRLSEEEIEKLKTKFGDNVSKKAILILNNYKMASGKKYKSDYHAMLNWVIDKAKVELGEKTEPENDKYLQECIRSLKEDSEECFLDTCKMAMIEPDKVRAMI